VKTLFHYTSVERWELIKASDRLNTTESNLSKDHAHAGPDVVWLTTDPDAAHDHGLGHSLDGTDKTRIRIEVQLPNRDVHKWKEWAIKRGISPEWFRALTQAGDGVGTWRVCEKSIPSERWISVVDRHLEKVVWPDG
jgi:hypothetical protein